MEAMVIVVVLALVLEAVIQVVKGMVPEGVAVPVWLWPVVGAVLGILLCVAAGVDMLALAGVAIAVPYLGCVLTGVIISRGASFVHDLWGKINGDSAKDAIE